MNIQSGCFFHETQCSLHVPYATYRPTRIMRCANRPTYLLKQSYARDNRFISQRVCIRNEQLFCGTVIFVTVLQQIEKTTGKVNVKNGDDD